MTGISNNGQIMIKFSKKMAYDLTDEGQVEGTIEPNAVLLSIFKDKGMITVELED